MDLGDDKKWVIAGISIRTPLKPILTYPVEKQQEKRDEDDEVSTPTAEDARIPARLPCPPAPRKRRAASRCHVYNSAGREFFTPPDLETVFIRREQRT
ncbi:hypothetical protein NMG60_11009075 [Bertholletia excelsa]